MLGTAGAGTPSSGGNGSLAMVGGVLTLPGSGTITVNLTDNAGAGGRGSLGVGTYKLLSYTSLNSTVNNFNNIFSIGTTPLTGELYTFSDTGTGAGEVDLTIRPLPNSTTYTLSAGATASTIHVGGSSTITATIINTGTGLADSLNYTGLTVNANGGTIVGGTLPISGGPVANASGQNSGTTTFIGTSAGTYTITPVATTVTNSTIGGNATSQSTTSAIVNVYRSATAGPNSPVPVVFGNYHVGDAVTPQTLSIQNIAAADGFSENLDASFGVATGGVVATGSIVGLAPGGTDSTNLQVKISTTSAGANAGTVQLNLNSDGAGTSGLGVTALAPQSVTVTGGNVYRLAAPNTITTPINLGVVHIGESFPNQLLSIQNTVANDGFSEKLSASFGATTGAGSGNAGSIALLAPQSTDNTSMSVRLGGSANTVTAGAKTGTVVVNLTSDGGGTSGLGTTPLSSQSITVNGTVNQFAQPQFVQPSGAGALSGIGTSYSLNFGNVHANTGVYTANLALLNSLLDATFQDSLGGSFTTAGVTHFTLTGFNTFSGVASGTSQSGLQVSFDSGAQQGSWNDTLTFTPTSANASGVSPLAPITLLLTAQTFNILSNWTATAGGSWGTAANWDNGVPLAVGDSATLGNSIPASSAATITLDDARTVSGLTFSATNGRSYTIAAGSGGSLSLNNGTSNLNVNVVAGSQTISAPVSLSSSSVTTNIAAGAKLTISGILSGAGQLIHDGPGTLILTGANTNSGGVTISGGVLQGNAASLTSDITNDASLVFNQTIDGTYSNAIGGSGAVTKTGAANLTITGNNSYTGLTTIAVGTLTQNGATLTGNVDNQDTFVYSGGTFNGHLINEQTATFNAAFTAGNGMENDAIAANSGQNVTLNGAGLINYGSFTMNGGVLRLAAGAANQNIGNLTLATATSTLNLGGATLTNIGTLNLTGSLVNGSTGTLTNSASGTISGTGTITAQLNNNGGIVVGTGTLNVTQNSTNSGTIQLTGLTSSLNGGTIANSGTIQGFGNLGAAVTNTGTIEATGGTLNVGGALQNGATGLISADATSKVIVTAGLATNSGTINLIGGTFDNNSRPLNNLGQVSGYGVFRTGGLDNNGSITFGGVGPSTVNGDLTNENGRTVTVANFPAIFTGNVTNTAGGSFKVVGTSATFAGTFTDNSSALFTKSGSGLLQVNGAPTLMASSSLAVTDTGTLRFNVVSGSASIATGVTATVAAGATLELAGSVSALADGSNRVNVTNNSAAPGLLVSGTHQQVGSVNGLGTTEVNAGSDLTANHIVQSALIIGGAAGNPGLVTIDASDASGNPLGQSSGIALAGSLAPNDPFGAGGISSAGLSGGPDLAALSLGNSPGGGNPSPVPEPSALLLSLLAVLGVISTQFVRYRCRSQTA